ncbi:unnamed protein product [Anisakis simplex]|uniref:Hexosyltransferase n=1 Tax=Anisakis simplex TaxID=6269 RepID=A0A0M3IZL3_ANISI|nr:unnamed protein product [Anisakis simplex]
MYGNAWLRRRAITMTFTTTRRWHHIFVVLLLLAILTVVHVLLVGSTVDLDRYHRKIINVNGTSTASSAMDGPSTASSSLDGTSNTSSSLNGTSTASTQESESSAKPPQSQLLYYNYSAFNFLRLPIFQDAVECPNANVHFIIRSHPKAVDDRQFVRGSWGQTLKNHLLAKCSNASDPLRISEAKLLMPHMSLGANVWLMQFTFRSDYSLFFRIGAICFWVLSDNGNVLATKTLFRLGFMNLR